MQKWKLEFHYVIWFPHHPIPPNSVKIFYTLNDDRNKGLNPFHTETELFPVLMFFGRMLLWFLARLALMSVEPVQLAR